MIKVTEGYSRAVAAGCFHYPKTTTVDFQKWLDFVRVFQPEKLFLLGSLFHSKRSLRALNEDEAKKGLVELQDELKDFREKILVKIREILPQAEIIYLQGHTEKNIYRWCKVQKIDFNEAFLEPLGLEELKIEYIPKGEYKAGKFLFTNGKYAFKESVNSAKAELNEKGISGCSCCSHHIGAHYHTDYRGEMVWCEAGCITEDGVAEPGHVRQSAYSERGFLVGFLSKNQIRNKYHFHVFPVLFNGNLIEKVGKKEYVFFDPEIPRRKTMERVVEVSDFHLPYVHKKSLNSLLNFLAWFKPDKLYIVGDFIDLSQLSTFRDAKDPRLQVSFERDISKAKKVLQSIRQVIPEAKIYYIEGNHEERVKRFLLDHAAVFSNRSDLKIPRILRLDDLKIRWIPSRGGKKEHKFLIIHGEKVSKWSGDSARAELRSKGISGISGHTHRLGICCKTDEFGTRIWHEIGGFFQFNIYWATSNKPDWQRGFAVSFIDKRSRGSSKVILVPVIKGEVSYCGRDFSSSLS